MKKATIFSYDMPTTKKHQYSDRSSDWKSKFFLSEHELSDGISKPTEVVGIWLVGKPFRWTHTICRGIFRWNFKGKKSIDRQRYHTGRRNFKILKFEKNRGNFRWKSIGFLKFYLKNIKNIVSNYKNIFYCI